MGEGGGGGGSLPTEFPLGLGKGAAGSRDCCQVGKWDGQTPCIAHPCEFASITDGQSV